jgi:hypothetical protein
LQTMQRIKLPLRLGRVLRVIAQQIALAHQLVDHRVQAVVVDPEVGVALLDRQPRIAAGEALGLGLGEGDVASGEVLLLPPEDAARNRIPARVGTKRHLRQLGPRTRCKGVYRY